MTYRVGDVAAIPLPGGGFGAVQISAVTDGRPVVYSLDFQPARPCGPDHPVAQTTRLPQAPRGPRPTAAFNNLEIL